MIKIHDEIAKGGTHQKKDWRYKKDTKKSSSNETKKKKHQLITRMKITSEVH